MQNTIILTLRKKLNKKSPDNKWKYSNPMLGAEY